MSADNLSEKNQSAKFRSFINFLDKFGYGYDNRRNVDGFEDDNNTFRSEIQKYLKKPDKLLSPEVFADQIADIIFTQYSNGNLRANLTKKIIEDQILTGTANEEAEIYANRLLSMLFEEGSQTLDTSQIEYLKNKFKAYWKTIARRKYSKDVIKDKITETRMVFLPIDADESENETRNVKPLQAKTISQTESLLSTEYYEIYRKCLGNHLPELKNKYFRKLGEDYFSILIRRYFSNELTIKNEIEISPDEFIKNKSFVFRTIEWIWSGFGLKAKDYQLAAGNIMRSHDETREKISNWYGITLNDFDNKVSKAKSFLAEKMKNCLEINKSKKKV